MSAEFSVRANNGLIRMSGELDVSTRSQAFEACCSCTGPAVVLDLAELTFMDSRGYAAIIEAKHVLEAEGRTLTIRGIRGEPLRLVTLLGAPDYMEPVELGTK